jgi:TNF receptor-associated factor 4
MERQDLKSHIANDCPLTIVDCDFSFVGCEIRLPRKDLPSHLTEDLVAHVSLQTKQLMNLTAENQWHRQQTMMAFMNLTEENKRLKHQVQRLTKDFWEYQNGTMLCPARAELTMTDFEQHKKNHDEWNSPPFYTHPEGYKMCLLVCAGGNMYVSVFLMLMKGEYDDQLKWPLRSTFILQLLSQNRDERQDRVKPVTCGGDTAACSRVVDGDVAKTGIGDHKFIRSSELKPMYLQNDCLKFCITY